MLFPFPEQIALLKIVPEAHLSVNSINADDLSLFKLFPAAVSVLGKGKAPGRAVFKLRIFVQAPILHRLYICAVFKGDLSDIVDLKGGKQRLRMGKR